MATEFFGIVYFPTKSAFFEGAIPESMEAKYGIKGPYFLIKILCKIYKEGYYIPWDEEQCEIFAYKLGREYSKEEVTSMVSLLLEKGFFDQGELSETADTDFAGYSTCLVGGYKPQKKRFDQTPLSVGRNKMQTEHKFEVRMCRHSSCSNGIESGKCRHFPTK